MKGPRLFTTSKDIERIKGYIKEYDWYAKAYENIKHDVDDMLVYGFEVPKEKGYVFYIDCPVDGARLTFDPYRDETVCPKCGMRYRDENFMMARRCYYHHWLSQMAILAGIVYQISGEEKYAGIVKKILLGYVKNYPDYPNNDNELGTTKTFQSTYMESVWISYLAGAYDMVKDDDSFTQNDKLRIVNEFFKTSAAVIYDYDEGANNRQAFNNSGLCAVALISGDKELLDYVLEGPHGFRFHMENSVLEDGMWYEGDNYHFATVPSLVNIAEMCLGYGIDLYNQEFDGHRIKDLFDAPLISLQPDLTFPSRKDSPYKSYIGQRWYAGLYEVACRRYGKESFGGILKKMYESTPDKDASMQNAAGIMDNFPADVADRTRMDWRGFLNANPDLGEGNDNVNNRSVNMPGTGLSIIRQQNDESYCSLDYGHYGGEHGHPDRLQLSYFTNGRRWLTDYGTGQYYFEHLEWYRSTLGHNTVVVDEDNHVKAEGDQVIFGETDDFSIIEAAVGGIRPGVDMSRTMIKLQNGPLFDYVEMSSEEEHNYDYMLHSVGTLTVKPQEKQSMQLKKEGAYRFLQNIETYKISGDLKACFETEEAGLRIHMLDEGEKSAFTAKSYGSPFHINDRFPLMGVRQNAKCCKFVALLEDVENGKESKITAFRKDGEQTYVIETADKSYVFERTKDGWNIGVQAAGEERQAFSYKKQAPKPNNFKHYEIPKAPEKTAQVKPERMGDFEELYASEWKPNMFLDQESQIIRSEAHWQGGEDLSAAARMTVIGDRLALEIKVKDNTPCYIGGKFLCDNDSIQFYFRRKDAKEYQFIVRPYSEECNAEITEITNGTCPVKKIGVSGDIVEGGYEILLSIPFDAIGGIPEAGEKVGFDMVINDRDKGERRDKQMVWSGTRKGARTYLKQKKHPDGNYGTIIF